MTLIFKKNDYVKVKEGFINSAVPWLSVGDIGFVRSAWHGNSIPYIVQFEMGPFMMGEDQLEPAMKPVSNTILDGVVNVEIIYLDLTQDCFMMPESDMVSFLKSMEEKRGKNEVVEVFVSNQYVVENNEDFRKIKWSDKKSVFFHNFFGTKS